MAESTSRSGASSSALWIYNPWLDMVVGCGAWSAPLLLLTYFVATSNTLAWSVGFYALALFFNYPHYMATLYRAYHRQEDFHKYRVFTVHITALIVAALLFTHFWFKALPWIFTLYLTLSPWHYSGQNYGLFMMFARRAGAKPSKGEQRAIYAAFVVSYLVLLISFHTGISQDPMFLSWGIPGKISSIAAILLGIAFALLAAFGISPLSEQVGWRPLVPALTLFSTQFVWFLLPTALAFGERLRIPQSRYSTGILAIMHSAQYLWITSYYARREAKAEAQSNWRPLAYFGVLVVGGIALFVPGPWLASRVFHFDFTASFLIFTALVNIHHFILDGAIWKLRDGRIAALLVNSPEKIAAATGQTANSVRKSVSWVFGSAPPARQLRIGAAVLLLAWGTVDQVHYYLALRSDDWKDLERAAVLASSDTLLQMKLARKDMELGKPEEAVQAWRHAIRANPADAAPRDLLLRYLVQQKRFDEAYELSQDSVKHLPRNPDMLVNNGILAAQFGHSEEAVQSWRRALEIDPSQLAPHLYLATELQREVKPADAVEEYMIYLDAASRSTPELKPAPANVITAALKLAECHVLLNHPQAATQSYELAAKIASQTGHTKLESMALIGNAMVQAERRRVPEALRLYQAALQLDATLDDRRSEADDWYSYGIFLRDNHFPSQLVYACLLKSESLMKQTDGIPELKNISQIRNGLEKSLPEAAGLRRNPQSAWQEALHLRP
ncbi:MAG TPA: hypothetical protein VFA89_16225 [Terriglobales bacterium]|nr:hypothetical protein [Terriglobales bacterium]